MSASSLEAQVISLVEATVEDPQKRATLLAGLMNVGGNSKTARALKAIAFGVAAVAIAIAMPLGSAVSVAIAGAFATAALAEVHG